LIIELETAVAVSAEGAASASVVALTLAEQALTLPEASVALTQYP
jgi:hypothetical protein